MEPCIPVGTMYERTVVPKFTTKIVDTTMYHTEGPRVVIGSYHRTSSHKCLEEQRQVEKTDDFVTAENGLAGSKKTSPEECYSKADINYTSLPLKFTNHKTCFDYCEFAFV